MAASLNMDEVRGAFPALKTDQIFLDNAGGSQTLGTVAEAITDWLHTSNVQLGATYAVGKAATDKYKAGYAAAAKYVNAPVDEVVKQKVLGPSTTQLFRNLSYSLNFNPGDELVVSAIDHEANIAPWVDLAARQQLTLKWWRPDSTVNPKLTAEGVGPLLSDRTRLVAFTHASNILGTIHDVRGISKLVHAVVPQAIVVVDAVAYAPHRAVDVQALGCDVYAFSWYKVYGPHLSMLWAGRRAQAAMRSLGHFFNPSASLADKLGLGSASYELVPSLPAVVEYMKGKEEAIVAHEAKLQGLLLDYLKSRRGVVVHGETSSDPMLRVATVSFTVEGFDSQSFVEQVEKDSNLGFRWGSFYSNRLVEDFLGLGKTGVVRVGMVHYNTEEEIQILIAAFDKFLCPRE
ncbi:uncharacterized protein E0L32_007892 [Thyridium curvatum]|uniref:Aminotransferase class V domain-containing protein n=1 Tax=Thyridium curvatum TaxID=1093900 RepID=A0A507AUR7_9PEZI|nr:uncharacterized protein E0L32_007892 [Thyridium curvatum]TPX11473.1 hypothetical protein E0L32_007892 [Thyridium curvatum]